MRIIGGRWRSRKIDWPAESTTRPITDRAKQALFDSLGSRFGTPGELPAFRVADVFAGGGSLGLESLSRGATRVCFFERDARAVAVLKRNLRSLGVGPEAAIVAEDIWRTGVRPPSEFGPLDIVFLDPPFLDTRDVSETSKIASLLRRLAAGEAAPGATVVLRHERRVILSDRLGGSWAVGSSRTYGRSTISLLTNVGRESSPESDSVDRTQEKKRLLGGR